MKFLVFTFPSEDGLKNPPSAADYDAQTDWFRGKLAEGVIEGAWHGDDRAVFIFNADSLERLKALMDEIPLASLMQRKIEPLIDLFEHTARISGYLRARESRPAG